ncbi:HAD-IA family hydrolase [candidate division GN15 bacterium]|nr:HAD-IA family hydrolase [candidate division GN15 bacterium]
MIRRTGSMISCQPKRPRTICACWTTCSHKCSAPNSGFISRYPQSGEQRFHVEWNRCLRLASKSRTIGGTTRYKCMTNHARPIKGVFFDLYGTLLIYGDMKAAWAAWLSTLHDCLAANACRLSADELAAACEGLFSLPEPPPDGTGLTVFERRLAGLLRRLKHELPKEVLSSTAMRCVSSWQAFVTLDPDAVHVLDKLAPDYHLALISNFDHPPHARKVLEQTRLDNFFNTVTISAEVGVKKPDPAIFDFSLAKAGLQPRQVVYVGDSDEDEAAADAVGMFFVRLERDRGDAGRVVTDFTTNWDDHDLPVPGRNGKASNTPVITTLAELPTLVEAMNRVEG